MGGHATQDEREARSTFPADLFAYWGQRDPIGLYEEFLKGCGIRAEELARLEHAAAEAVDSAAEEALADRDHLPAPHSALAGVYATTSQDTGLAG